VQELRRAAENRASAENEQRASELRKLGLELDAARAQRSVNVSKNSVQFLVDGRPWTRKLGANLRAYFFLAYHYAWLKLCRTEPFTYPGFALLDFPANLSDFTISDQENYLLAPFVKLLSKPEMQGAQLIASGRAFADLAGAHHIRLNKKWR
jgi:hypothetical protein